MSDDNTNPEATEEDETETDAPEADETESDGLEPIPEKDAWDKDRALTKIRKLNAEVVKAKEKIADSEAKAVESQGKDERLTALEDENLRLRIGVKHGLPESLVKRLSGTTEEEILQDAEELMELFGGAKKPPTNQPREKLRGGGDPTQTASTIGDLDKFAEEVFRN